VPQTQGAPHFFRGFTMGKQSESVSFRDWMYLLVMAFIAAAVCWGAWCSWFGKTEGLDLPDQYVPDYEFGPIDHPGFLDPVPEEIDEKIRQVLLKTLYYEAAGEGAKGVRLVASVIYNRASGRDFKSVCLEPKQFSCWNGGEPKEPVKSSKAYDICKRVADEMLSGRFRPEVLATHYHATYVKPAWAGRMQVVAKHKKHIFYK